MIKIHRDERGMTLVEVLVSMLLLAAGVLTAITIIAGGKLANDLGRDRLEALNLAEQTMEEWIHRGDLKALVGTDEAFTKPARSFQSKITDVNPFTVRVTVSNTGDTNLVKIEVKVTRKYRERKDQVLELSRLATIRRV